MTIENPEPLDGVEWEAISTNAWFCGVYRYRFDFEAIIKVSNQGRFDWSVRLTTDASGEPECEEFGDYASLARASNKVQALFAEWTTPLSVQGRMPY